MKHISPIESLDLFFLTGIWGTGVDSNEGRARLSVMSPGGGYFFYILHIFCTFSGSYIVSHPLKIDYTSPGAVAI